MKQILTELLKIKKNFVFVGEAGSGKSEIAINFAVNLAKLSDKPVHFFDVDQTKPLFRSRDVKEKLQAENVQFHYEEQFFDAPTIVGGVREHLMDENVIVVIDVGGDHLGARLIGGFAPILNREFTQNFFVINSYRPWSKDLVAIDGTMARVLGMAHIELSNVSIMSNPNVGFTTTAEEAVSGNEKVSSLIDEYFSVDYMCAREEICPQIKDKVQIPLLPIKLYLTYEWSE
ncbi:Uncharacterised protein [uncultured Eubacterium sp.]|nr:Uncharacterised protein [uncultured Eubacterium sp.]